MELFEAIKTIRGIWENIWENTYWLTTEDNKTILCNAYVNESLLKANEFKKILNKLIEDIQLKEINSLDYI